LIRASIADWAAVGSAAAAALAAIAAWRAVVLAGRRSLPRLQGYGLQNSEGRIGAVVRNSCGGTAEACHVMLTIHGGAGFATSIGAGFLGPGEGVRVWSPIQIESGALLEAKVVTFCRDSNMILRAWSSDGGRRVYRNLLGRRSYPSNDQIYGDFFPEVNLGELTGYPVVLEWVNPPRGWQGDLEDA
jgi:hypothetical protein